MKKGKKLLINTILILIILLFAFYFGGYYLSKEQCIMESLRGLYAKETEIIMELKRGNRSRVLVADTDNKTHSIIGVKKMGLLYHVDNTHSGMPIKEENVIDIVSAYGEEIGTVIIVYRNDKSVAKVEVEFDSGDVVTMDDWKKDYVGCLEKENVFSNGVYRAYNASSELIGELEW